MASTTSHFLIGAALALPALRNSDLKGVLPRWSVPLIAGVLAASPDLDLASKHVPGIASISLLSHRGLFHSPFFLVLLAAELALVVTRLRARPGFSALWWTWAVSMLTHPVLDAFSRGGVGLMLFLPLSNSRFFFLWRPIYNPAGSGEPLLIRAWLMRASELPFCMAALLIGICGLLATGERDGNSRFLGLHWKSLKPRILIRHSESWVL